MAATDGLRFGVTVQALAGQARRRHWEQPHPGVFMLPGAADTFALRTSAACLAVGGRVLAARSTAAFLWDMADRRPRTVELVVPYGRGVPRLDGVLVHRSRNLVRSDRRVRDGIPLTSPERTVLDLAGELALPDLRALVIDGRQRRLLTLEALAARHRSLPRYAGRARVARVLRDLDAETCDSRLEWDWRRLLRSRGLRPYPRPFPFTCSDGVTIELDVAFPEHWVYSECDGFGSHSERSDLARHHRRQNASVVDGWRPLLVDWTRLSRDPDGLLADLRALLGCAPARPPAAAGNPFRIDPRYRGRRRAR